MRTERTPEERLVDDAISLALLLHVQNEEGAGDRLKVMKLLFLTNYQLFSQRAKGLNLTFYRYKFGPFSNEAEESWDSLKLNGYLLEEEEFALTDEGRRLAEAFQREVLARPENVLFRETILAVSKAYGHLRRDEIMQRVYAMQVSDVEGHSYTHLADAPPHTLFTQVLEDHEAKVIVSIDPGWLDTLHIVLDRSRRESLAHAIEQVRAGKTLTHEHVWPAV
jgi:hypothetical protein